MKLCKHCKWSTWLLFQQPYARCMAPLNVEKREQNLVTGKLEVTRVAIYCASLRSTDTIGCTKSGKWWEAK